MTNELREAADLRNLFSAWTCSTNDAAKSLAGHGLALLDRIAELEGERDKLRKLLEPFATAVTADEDGWNINPAWALRGGLDRRSHGVGAVSGVHYREIVRDLQSKLADAEARASSAEAALARLSATPPPSSPRRSHVVPPQPTVRARSQASGRRMRRSGSRKEIADGLE